MLVARYIRRVELGAGSAIRPPQKNMCLQLDVVEQQLVTPFQTLESALRFIVDGRMEDQGGFGFPVQDGVGFSYSSCVTYLAGSHRIHTNSLKRGKDFRLTVLL
ncbi:hypothetical protein R3P38DRAFT_3039794, partial [Favolaschia claudopus]